MPKFPLLALLALLPLGSLQARQFTSADGKQTLEAEFVRYSKKDGKVTLRLANGRNMVADASHFSASDQAFFEEKAKSSSLSSAVDVEVNENSERETRSGSQLRIRYEKFNFEFEIRNRSEFDLKDLKVKHWVVADRGGKPTVYKDETSLSSVAAKGSSDVAGPKFALITSARATCDCPKVIEQAKKMGGQKVVGTRVEVYGPDGSLIYEDSSSSKVDKAIGK